MRFSPDGRSVAFESSRGAGRHIWRVDIGAEPVQLTSDPKFEETFPQWSPDGNTIAFTRQPAQSPNAKSLWLMDTDGANPRQILEGNNLTRWLPDGSGFLYQNLKNQIFSLRACERPLSADSHSAGRCDHAHAESRRKVDRLSIHEQRTPVTSMFTRSAWTAVSPAWWRPRHVRISIRSSRPPGAGSTFNRITRTSIECRGPRRIGSKPIRPRSRISQSLDSFWKTRRFRATANSCCTLAERSRATFGSSNAASEAARSRRLFPGRSEGDVGGQDASIRAEAVRAGLRRAVAHGGPRPGVHCGRRQGRHGSVLPGVTVEASSPVLIEKAARPSPTGPVSTGSSTCGPAPTR